MRFAIKHNRFTFRCPGCGYWHSVPIDGSRGWKFNGDMHSPTITPSICETRGHYIKGHSKPPNCKFCNDYELTDAPDPVCGRCHLFVIKGLIQFCDDSTHALAGKTVPMIEFDEHE